MKRAVATLRAGTKACMPAGTSGELRVPGRSIDDPMRRFVRCPYTADLSAAGRVVRLETNYPKLCEHMVELFARYQATPNESPQFLWRIVVESGPKCSPPWPRRATLSDEGIRFAHFGQRNFLAVDLDAREAIGFISQGLFEDAHGFTSPFIDTLFYMTAGALGLFPFAAACVRSGQSALLVLGPPNQGKTTASYIAAQNGLTFHADQSVFLEIVNDEMLAWSDFVPLAFRPEALHYLPDLRSRTRAFSYCDFSFYYMPREQLSTDQFRPVRPTCCVVLERGTSSVSQLGPLTASETSRCLSEYVAFKDDRRFEEQQRQVLTALAALPMYRLAYDSDPASAAPFFQTLLSSHERVQPLAD